MGGKKLPWRFRISWRGRPYIGYFPPSLNSLFRKTYGKCPRCGHKLFGGKLVVRNGKHGRFLGCTNYPNCTYTKDFVDKKKVKKDV